MHNLLRTSAIAFRQLRKSPGFSLTAVLTLTMAIGANIVVFGVLNALVFHPLPFPRRTGSIKSSTESVGLTASPTPITATSATAITHSPTSPTCASCVSAWRSTDAAQAGLGIRGHAETTST